MVRKVLLLLMCLMLVAGCGQNSDDNASRNPAERISEFQVLSEAGFYGDLRMQPNGVFLVRNKMSEEESLTAGVVYKVEFNEENKLGKITAMQGGIPISVDWQDNMNNKFQFCAITVEYPENRVKYNFRSSRMAATPGFYDAYSIAYKIGDDKKNPVVAYLYNKDGEQSNGSRGYSQMFFTYDDKGNLSKIGFADDGGNRVTNTNREYELRLKYGNKPGLITEIANYGKDGSLMVAANGIAKTTFKLDDRNRVIEVRHYGSDEALKDKNNPNLELDKALSSLSAGAITRYTYDGDTDRVIKISFLGKDEQAEGIKAWGNIASLEMRYTPEGWISSIASFATDDTPIALSKELFGDNVVKLGMEHDEFGNLSKTIFYGKEDNPVTSATLGAAECRYKYDDKRRQTGQEYYGTGGDKIEINDTAKGFKYHGFTYEYNDDDERTLVIYYDTTANEVRRQTLTTHSSEVDSGKSSNLSANNSSSEAQPVSKNTPPPQGSPTESTLSLGGVHLGDSVEKMRSILGREDRTTPSQTAGHSFHYEYRDIVITCDDGGRVIGLVTYTSNVATERNLRQGSPMQQVFDTYGLRCSVTNHDGSTLYEYPYEAANGKLTVLRFAAKNNRVDYISLRQVSGQERSNILANVRTI